ncbi:hypothetical protein EVAR_14352_1 [Eumeta japonica]|uniref:CTNNB1 binding N-teminal domain-containing protein n=1 Tax=Eumeta variegata TaxID=151549 RepID=A0A4C1TX31_EUMVA|nr:hypothetical protein EVAR_14352_1 [Eumeta japonica]
MPHAHSSSAASSGGDDLGSTDEIKVFKDEGDGEDEKSSSENLREEKSSLIDWTESEVVMHPRRDASASRCPRLRSKTRSSRTRADAHTAAAHTRALSHPRTDNFSYDKAALCARDARSVTSRFRPGSWVSYWVSSRDALIRRNSIIFVGRLLPRSLECNVDDQLKTEDETKPNCVFKELRRKRWYWLIVVTGSARARPMHRWRRITHANAAITLSDSHIARRGHKSPAAVASKHAEYKNLSGTVEKKRFRAISESITYYRAADKGIAPVGSPAGRRRARRRCRRTRSGGGRSRQGRVDNPRPVSECVNVNKCDSVWRRKGRKGYPAFGSRRCFEEHTKPSAPDDVTASVTTIVNSPYVVCIPQTLQHGMKSDYFVTKKKNIETFIMGEFRRSVRALTTSSVQYSNARGREKERYTKVESRREKETHSVYSRRGRAAEDARAAAAGRVAAIACAGDASAVARSNCFIAFTMFDGFFYSLQLSVIAITPDFDHSTLERLGPLVLHAVLLRVEDFYKTVVTYWDTKVRYHGALRPT